jgi:regulatory protein
VWHKNGVNAHPKRHKRGRPLDEEGLRDLALKYVGRFATTRAKLRQYLGRKLRERGWEGAQDPDVEALAARFSELGLIDDSGYALAKSRSLTARGYGRRRVEVALRSAGIDDADGGPALDHAGEEAVAAALRFAQRRRMGPFAAAPTERPEREKALAAMIRAGHSFALAQVIVRMEPGAPIDIEELTQRARQGV